MIEELAKTAFESFYAGSDLGWRWEGQIEKTKEHYRKMIRAILVRMKKPTEEMRQVPSGRGQVGPMGASEVWEAMIDAALQEDKP